MFQRTPKRLGEAIIYKLFYKKYLFKWQIYE